MRYQLREDENLLEVVISEALTKAEILDLWKDIADHYSHASCALLRVDGSRWDITGEEIHSLADSVSRLPQIPYALIGADTHSFGMFRMFTLWLDEHQPLFKVFRDEKSAREWLRAGGCGPTPDPQD